MGNIKNNKILIFSTGFDPFIGGAEVAIKEIANRVESYDFDMITPLFDSKLSRFEKIGSIGVYRVGFGFWFDKYFLPVFGLFKAIRLQKKNNYDIVWGMMAMYAGFAALLFKLIFRKLKYLLTLQSGDSDMFLWIRTWFWYPLYRLIYKRADYIQVISNYLADRARRYGYKGELSLVPNGVDLLRFDKRFTEDELASLKNKLGFNPDDTILVHTGRLVKKNALADIIKALPDLDNKIKFLIIGKGKLENKLKSLVANLKLEDRVVFHDFVPHDEMVIYLHMSDIFIRPSLTEGLGNSFLEAMACKLPVVATEVGGIRDFLINRETGIVCKVKDPESIVIAVEGLLGDDGLKNNIIVNSFNMIEQRYNWELVAKKMKQIFEKI